MKLVVASDIHGSAYYCAKFLERYKQERADKLLLLGDLLYHGARNALPRDYDTLKTAALLNSVKEEILCVRGNCDSQVDTLVLEFPVLADFALLSLNGRTVIAAHGHLPYPDLKTGEFLLNGHFHVPMYETRENYTYVNCGSVSIPKEDSPHSYLVWEDNALLWKDVETGQVFRRENLK